MNYPLTYQWDGEVFRPVRAHKKVCDARFVVGEVYTLDEVKERSQASHAHYFAVLNDLWLNLPEMMGDQFPTSEHLRKFALIKTGYRDERSLSCASRAEALRVAAFIRPIDEYAIITVTGSMVTEFTAKSQRKKAMGNAQFQKSKSDVLEYIESLIGAKNEQ